MNWITWILGVFALVAMSVGTIDLARAERLAVAPFDGPRGAVFQRSVEKALSGRHTLVSSKVYDRTARRLGARPTTNKNVARVATRLQADGVVTGSVVKKGRRFRLTVKVRSAATGEVVGSAQVVSPKPRLNRSQERTLARKLASAVARLPGSHAAPDQDASEQRVAKAEPAKPTPANKREAPESGARNAKTQEIRREPDPASARESASVSSSLVDDRPSHEAFALAAGMGVTQRRLGFQVAEGIADRPQEYSSNPVASVHITGEVYPLALFGKPDSVASRFGLIGGYDRILLLSSRLDTGDMQLDLATTHAAWRAGAVYRHTVGRIAIRASVAVASIAFDIDTTEVPAGVVYEMPDVGYTMLDPGLSVHLPITDQIAVTAGGDFLYALERGAIGDATAYGDGSASGFRALLLFQYRLSDAFSVRAVGQLTRIGHSFDGTGSAGNFRDGDPNTNDVPAATDRYINVYATAGYQF